MAQTVTDQASSFVAPAVVVGIDGSRAALRAAVWAIEEAADREVPLRLVGVRETTGSGADTAEAAVREAAAAVTATGRGVTVQTEVLTGAPILALLEAARTASMLCVGSVGLRTAERVGSTARALVASARCPVAVVRGGDRQAAAAGWVVVELDETPDSAAVLQWAVAEARLRTAPLRVLGCVSSRGGDGRDPQAVAEGIRLVGAQLDRRLSQWRHRYPDLDVRPEAVHGSGLDYLGRHAAQIALVVVGARNSAAVEELLGPAGQAALRSSDATVLIIDPQRLL